MIRILLVEDHILVRQSIRAFLVGAAFEVVGEAGTGEEAVQLAMMLHPDVVLLDIHLPGMNGIEAARTIKATVSQSQIIALTAYDDTAYQRALEQIGVAGFVLKTAEFSELLAVIRQVVSPEEHAEEKVLPSESGSLLTEREAQVLDCMAKGWTNKEIGLHLGISSRTVQVHLQTIYHKLDVTNRTEAMRRALKLRLITAWDGESE
jgi:two-component system, NarL family, response regulator LiaR